MIHIIYNSLWEETTERIIDFLGEYYCEFPSKAKIILNTGTHEMRGNYKALILNSNSKIQADKILMNKLLDKHEILHPKTYYYPFHSLPKGSIKDCVLKQKNSVFLPLKENFNDVRKKLEKDTIIQEFIPFEKEYRVVKGPLGIISIMEKKLLSSYHSWYKKSCNCKFKEIKHPKLGKFCLDVCEKLNIDFTGMDVGEFLGKFIVIELNSAPALGRRNAERLANQLISLLYQLKKN